MQDKMFLQWSDFPTYLNNSFQDLRNEEELFDVTLACDDGKQLEAHKVILSACSPIFRQMMARSKHPHPLVFMTGVNSREMENLFDFIYKGEFKVEQKDLLGFLSIAQKFKIQGLTNFQTTEVQTSDQIVKVEKEDRDGVKKLQCLE